MKRVSLLNGIKKLVILWLSCSLFMLLIILVQTLLGKYVDASDKAWWWFFFNFLPGNLILLIGYFRHKRLSSITLTDADFLLYQVIYWLSFFYLFTIIAVMLFQPFGNPEYSIIQRLHSADTGLYIFQGILLLAFGVMIYKTERKLAAIREAETEDNFAGEPGVFISYNHSDKEVADKLKALLENENIPVTIDSEAMKPGEEIKSFIENSVLKNRTTISVVSNKSLLSGWVGMETLNTFFLQKYSKSKQFISCYLDADFFDIQFTGMAIESFDRQLKEVNEQIEKHNSLNIDTRDLNDYKSRILSLRNNLDEIIQKLRNSLCVDIRDEKLINNFPQILRSVNPD